MRNKMIMLIPVLFLMTLVGFNNINEKENREVSPSFSLPVTFGDGTKGEYLMIGEEGKVGLLVGSGKTGAAVERKVYC